MKKVLLPLFFILLIISCKKQIVTDKLPEEIASISVQNSSDKIMICHYEIKKNTWNTINISKSALQDHLAHGDIRLDDQDMDGYVPTNACGFGQMGDCNDLNAAINPGSTDICDGIDENCNGIIDDNCIPAVKICNQTWMLKNLDVFTYRNGDEIPQVTDVLTWASLTTGAWCYLYNDAANGAVYGKLYNYYAVIDPRGLAPKGWHVSSFNEWETLTNCLGGPWVAGYALKSTSGWYGGGNGSNISGFTALPGEFRPADGGIFYDSRISANWWSPVDYDVSNAFNGIAHRVTYFNDWLTSTADFYKGSGLSVRCVRD